LTILFQQEVLVEKKPYITFLVQRQEINNVKKLIVIHKKSATILSAHYFSPPKIEAAKTELSKMLHY